MSPGPQEGYNSDHIRGLIAEPQNDEYAALKKQISDKLQGSRGYEITIGRWGAGERRRLPCQDVW